MTHSDPAPQADRLATQLFDDGSAADVRAAVREGLDADAVRMVREALGLTAAELARLLGVSARTLERLGDGRLAPPASDRLARLVGVADKAADVLGPDHVAAWLRHPIPALNDEAAIEWLDTDAGVHEVLAVLTHIEYGEGF